MEIHVHLSEEFISGSDYSLRPHTLTNTIVSLHLSDLSPQVSNYPCEELSKFGMSFHGLRTALKNDILVKVSIHQSFVISSVEKCLVLSIVQGHGCRSLLWSSPQKVATDSIGAPWVRRRSTGRNCRRKIPSRLFLSSVIDTHGLCHVSQVA